MEVNYTEVLNRLRVETAIVAFYKKNGNFRTMIATRNIGTAAIGNGYMGDALGRHSSRCNASNGNIAIVDLAIGETRSFNTERIVDLVWLGEITTPEELEKALINFRTYTDNYKQATLGSGLFEDDEVMLKERQDNIGEMSSEQINSMFEV